MVRAKPAAQHEGVETHLEQLDEVLTGQALGAAGLVEDDAQLLLADAVLLAQALLLAQADGVVAVGLALGAAVLTRSVGALLEVLGGLRGQRDAERAGQADLAAVLGLGDQGGSFQDMAAAFAAHGRAPHHPRFRAHVDATGGSECGMCSESNRNSLPDQVLSPAAGVASAGGASRLGIGLPASRARRRSSRGPTSRSYPLPVGS